MERVKFGDVVREVKENIDRNTDQHEFYIAGEHMDSENIHITRRGRFEGSDVGPAFIRLFKPGQILYGSRRTYLKKVAVADFEGVTSNTTFVLESKDPEKLLQGLLPFIMLTDSFTEYAIKNSKGSTNPYILFSDLAEYEFELPELREQKQLLELLIACDEAKEAYKKQLQATEELVKSQFIEMFGDASASGDEWKRITVRDAVKEGYIARPLDGNHGEKHPKGDDYVPTGVPFIMAQDLKDKRVDFENCHFITEKQAKTLKKGWAKTGDVLLTHKGTIGRVAVVQPSQYEDMLLTPQITYYRCLKDLDNEYLAAYFTTDNFVKQLQSMITGTTRASVTITQQEGLELIIPPMDMQKHFVAFVEQSDKSKFELQESIKRVDGLIKSLMQSEN